jgi:hypothetical protein
MIIIRYLLASFLFISSSTLLAAIPNYLLPNNEWHMISLPLTPPKDANTVRDIFGDDLPIATYNTDWVLYQFDTATNQYGNPLGINDALAPGKGYWIIQKTGGNKLLDMPQNSYYTKPNPFDIPLDSASNGNKHQWNLVGHPFNVRTTLSDYSLSGVYETLWRYKYTNGKGNYEKVIKEEDTLKPWDAFWVASKKNGKITTKTFGIKGSYNNVTWEDPNKHTVLYRPKGLTKRPVIFYAPGWSNTCKEYSTLLEFVSSHGYAVICNNKDNFASPDPIIEHFKSALKNEHVLPYIDLNRMGVMGFSSGGGNAFKVLKEFSHDGNKGHRFLFVMEQWFAFSMTKDDMKGLKDTNVVFIQFGKDGNNKIKWGEYIGKSQDPRILLTQYSLLTGAGINKDYQIFSDTAHLYPKDQDYDHLDPKSPYDRVSEMQGILRPLDALMEYTFGTKSEEAHKAALEVGTDQPYKKGYQKLRSPDNYDWTCSENREQRLFDHCGSYDANL